MTRKVKRYTNYSTADVSDLIACTAANIDDAYALCGVEDHTAKECVELAALAVLVRYFAEFDMGRVSLLLDTTPHGPPEAEEAEEAEEEAPATDPAPEWRLYRDTDVVASVRPNPKQRGCGAWHRYNRYQVGKTIGALKRTKGGPQSADIRHDVKKGYITLRPANG